jgi:hypothetical protein
MVILWSTTAKTLEVIDNESLSKVYANDKFTIF